MSEARSERVPGCETRSGTRLNLCSNFWAAPEMHSVLGFSFWIWKRLRTWKRVFVNQETHLFVIEHYSSFLAPFFLPFPFVSSNVNLPNTFLYRTNTFWTFEFRIVSFRLIGRCDLTRGPETVLNSNWHWEGCHPWLLFGLHLVSLISSAERCSVIHSISSPLFYELIGCGINIMKASQTVVGNRFPSHECIPRYAPE